MPFIIKRNAPREIRPRISQETATRFAAVRLDHGVMTERQSNRSTGQNLGVLLEKALADAAPPEEYTLATYLKDRWEGEVDEEMLQIILTIGKDRDVIQWVLEEKSEAPREVQIKLIACETKQQAKNILRDHYREIASAADGHEKVTLG